MSAIQSLLSLLSVARSGERTLIAGILNVTPDSFSDGGRFLDSDDALRQAERMLEEGADFLDIGGESTRPATFADNAPLTPKEELQRIRPIIKAISSRFPALPISVDTYKSEVASEAILVGAVMLNDISAFLADPKMASIAAKSGVAVCLMHLPGLPRALTPNPVYMDVMGEVKAHLLTRAAAAIAMGVKAERIILDPGFGFGKSLAQNLELLRRLRELADTGYLTLSGTSRKSMIGKVLGDLPPEDRLEGTAATVALSIANGASIVRVHDVKQMARVARMTDAVVRANGTGLPSKHGYFPKS